MSDPTHNSDPAPHSELPAGPDTDPAVTPDSGDDSVVDPHWRSTTRARLVAAAGLAALTAAVTATIVATHHTPAGYDTDDAGGPVDASSSAGATDSTSSSTAPSGSTSSPTGSSSPTSRPASTSAPAGPSSGRGEAAPSAGRSGGSTAGAPIGSGGRPTAPRRQSSGPSHRPSSHRPSPSRRTKTSRPSTPSTKPAPPYRAHWVYVAGPAAFNGHKIGSYSTSLARGCADSSDLSACSTSGVQWGGGCSNLYYGATVPAGAPVGWAVWEFADGQCKYAMSAGNPGGD